MLSSASSPKQSTSAASAFRRVSASSQAVVSCDLDEYFGDNTVDKTKLLANIFNPALEDAAKNLGVDYITEETVGYDAILLSEEIENKLTLGKDSASFATGNNHSKTKVDKIFVCKLSRLVTTSLRSSLLLLICHSLRILPLVGLIK